MPAYFTEGFSVRERMWHGMGEVLADYPGRELAMQKAGHAWDIDELPIAVIGDPVDVEATPAADDAETYDWAVLGETVHRIDPAGAGWKALKRSDTGGLLNVVKDSYTVIPNAVGWDVVDAIVGSDGNARYETGITMKDGAVCSVLAWLDEPVQIPGDDSPILPWVNVSWAHDGSAGLSARPTSIRTVCWNTQSAAEALGKTLGREYTFRHTKNVLDRIEAAKEVMLGVREDHLAVIELSRELAKIKITKVQREEFVQRFVPMPPDAIISDRVVKNVNDARDAIRALFDGPSVPDAHRFTAYGLHLAGVEYLDHLRAYRNSGTYYGRTMMRDEPAKAKMSNLIRDVVKA